jgi:hypothetical protein
MTHLITYPAEIRIEIFEIYNGWTVKFFSRNGPTELDRDMYYPTLPEVLDAINDYYDDIYDGGDETE